MSRAGHSSLNWSRGEESSPLTCGSCFFSTQPRPFISNYKWKRRKGCPVSAHWSDGLLLKDGFKAFPREDQSDSCPTTSQALLCWISLCRAEKKNLYLNGEISNPMRIYVKIYGAGKLEHILLCVCGISDCHYLSIYRNGKRLCELNLSTTDLEKKKG